MTFEPVWGTIIAWYLFLAGLGGGAFITSAYLHLRAPYAVHLIRYGRIIGPVAVCIGLVLLIFDATAGFHNPLRFVFLLTNFGSVMTWGVVFLAAFVVVALIVLVMDLLGKGRKVPLWLDVIGAALGLCVCVYTGCLLGVAKTFPLWNNALLPVLFLVSAVSTGMAAVLLVGIFRSPREFSSVADLKKFHFWLPVVELFLVASLLFVTASSAESAGYASVMNLLVGDCSPCACWCWWRPCPSPSCSHGCRSIVALLMKGRFRDHDSEYHEDDDEGAGRIARPRPVARARDGRLFFPATRSIVGELELRDRFAVFELFGRRG